MAGLNLLTTFAIAGLFSALLTGLFFALFVQGLVRKGTTITKNLLHDKMSSPDVLNSINEHFADFVRNRLGKEMPVFNMFIDEKLIYELRNVFQKEVSRQLPGLAQQWMGNPKELMANLSSIIWRKSLPFLLLTMLLQILTVTFIGWILS